MFPIWFILGIVTILVGVFNRQIMQRLGTKSNSVVFAIPSRKRSSRLIEQMGQWLVVTLGVSFLILGLGKNLPAATSDVILFVLLAFAGVLLLAMICITVANWKTK